MKKQFGIIVTAIVLIILIIFILKSPDSNVATIDSFENTISAKTIDFGASKDSSLVVTASKDIKVCGRQSIKLEYDLKNGGYMWCARGYNLDVPGALWPVKPEQVKWENFHSISFSMYGQNKGSVAFDLKDSGGELHRFMVKDNFEGWKKITIPFNQFVARADWQPQTADGNKKIDYPIMSFQWEPKSKGNGTLYFDCVEVE